MNNAPDYARIVIANMMKPQLNRRLFGGPYLKYGQCPALWGYLFELGGILAVRHATQLRAFASAFLGSTGDSAALKVACEEIASNLVLSGRVNGSMSCFSYAQAAYLDLFPDYGGDAQRFLTEHAMDKIQPDPIARTAYSLFAMPGVALGAIHPECVKAMFDRTHTLLPKEQWEQAYAAGLDIGPEQPRKSYEAAEEEENNLFMAFCKECHPEVYSSLKGAQTL